MQTKKLTICTVSYKSKKWIELNYRLIRRLNPTSSLSWTVVENTPPGIDSRINPHDRRFMVLDGTKFSRNQQSSQGSYQHAQALQKALERVKTDYVLFLDPDFFIIMPEAIEKMITHMQSHNIHFFGAPYYPARVDKYRYFPCGIFLCIDLRKVHKRTIDFMPLSDEIARIWSLPFYSLMKVIGMQMIDKFQDKQNEKALFRMVLKNKLLSWFLWQRFQILSRGRSFDVGYRLFTRFGKDKRFRFENLTPSWDNPFYSSSRPLGRRVNDYIVRSILPDEWLVYPKKRHYATSQQFLDVGLPDLKGLGYEEYFWYNIPFGFHVQGAFQGKKNISQRTIEKIIKERFSHV